MLTVCSFRYLLKYVSQVIRGKGIKRFIDHLARLKVDQFSNGQLAKTPYQRQSLGAIGAVCDNVRLPPVDRILSVYVIKKRYTSLIIQAPVHMRRERTRVERNGTRKACSHGSGSI